MFTRSQTMGMGMGAAATTIVRPAWFKAGKEMVKVRLCRVCEASVCGLMSQTHVQPIRHQSHIVLAREIGKQQLEEGRVRVCWGGGGRTASRMATFLPLSLRKEGSKPQKLC
mmetsp:Transcript_20301/g.28544  ORF Transcript_20301/g.28544 Transcript_20301/m.28544 type:complete len:112 (+) Transcript_20301:349-684(+)